MRGILGGTGFYRMADLVVARRQVVRTPYGLPSGALTFGCIAECDEIVFLARHGYGHTLAPHLINYRANLWALREVGVTQIVSVATTGGIREDCNPGALVIPDQVIDYTWGRASTFVDSEQPVVHPDMTEPFSAPLRAELLEAAKACGVETVDGGTYGCTQGPRLETAAEIRRLRNDGCDLVGMTVMPEAALACELGMEYAALCIVSNHAAGIGDSQRRISFDGVQQQFEDAMLAIQQILGVWCKLAPR